MFDWYRNLPTWGKWALPLGALGAGYLLLRGGGAEGGDEGAGDDGGAVLPLITPSTGPSFPAGAFHGGSDYAPPPGSGGGGLDDPKDDDPKDDPKDDDEGGSNGGGGPGGTDKPPAPPNFDDYTKPPPGGPGPLTPGQQNKILARLRQINQALKDKIEDLNTRRGNAVGRNETERAAKIQAINASAASNPIKTARRQGVNAAAAAEKLAINARFRSQAATAEMAAAAARVTARAMFGEGRM